MAVSRPRITEDPQPGCVRHIPGGWLDDFSNALGSHMARRDGCSKHVTDCACVALGNRLSELQDLRRQHRLRAEDSLDRAQVPLAVTVLRKADDESAQQPTGKPNPYPRSEAHLKPSRDPVVEWAIKLRQGRVDAYLGDGRDRMFPGRPPVLLGKPGAHRGDSRMPCSQVTTAQARLGARLDAGDRAEVLGPVDALPGEGGADLGAS